MVERKESHAKVYYEVNPSSPLFAPFKEILEVVGK